jgi:hypothetical protein
LTTDANGNAVVDGVPGLDIRGGNSTVRGLVIQQFQQYGLVLDGSSGDTVAGNYIGTDATGNGAMGNGSGILVLSANNTIGGTIPADRNVISGNGDAIDISGSAATGNLVEGNFSGTNAAGTAPVPGWGGVILYNGATGNTIGGASFVDPSTGKLSGAGNLMSGLGGAAIWMTTGAGGNTVQGNFIGTDITGKYALPDDETSQLWNSAVSINTSGNLIGGASSLDTHGNLAGLGNLISANDGYGVGLWGVSNDEVEGNFIGTDVTGTHSLGNAVNGVLVSGTSNTIGGTTAGTRNVISGNARDGVRIDSSGTAGNVVAGNYIGTNAAGTAALPNQIGVLISGGSTGNTVGGTAAGARNVISGNAGDGVRIDGSGTVGNWVAGNYIGTDATGTAPVGNSGSGVELVSYAAGNLVGGTSAGAGNVLSGNSVGARIGDGALGNTLEGNRIGTDAQGSAALGNSTFGIVVQGAGANNVIGGTDPGAGNVSSANGITNLWIVVSSGTLVQGNFFGTDASGTAPLGSVRYGITIQDGSANTIGGTTPAARNVIAGTRVGLMVDGPGSTGNLVQGNSIGLNAAGTAALAGVFIWFSASHNTIGGTAAGAGNVITLNQGAGVVVTGAASTGNAIRGNSIHDNGGLGIDLGNDGVTPNTPGGPHTGPNDLQNFPVLAAAQAGATASVRGTLNGQANTPFALDFYASPSADPSGYGQGQYYLGNTTVDTDASGNASFAGDFSAANLPGGAVPAGWVISATATNAAVGTPQYGDTSEFSADVPAQALAVAAGGPYSSPEGSGVTFTASASPSTTVYPLTYTWTVNGHTVPGDNGGASPTLTLTWTQLQGLGILDEGPAVAVGVQVDDGHGHVAGASTTLMVVDAPLSATGSSITGIEGQPINNIVVATFTDANPAGTLADYSASIAWGDNTTSAGTILAGTNGTYYVLGSHTYTEEGSAIPMAVTITDAGGASATANTTATVADAALTAGALTPPAATEGIAFGPTTVFHFTDADPSGAAGDYAATVQTGDTTLTSTANPGNVQVVANTGGGFDVQLSYTYAEELSNQTFAVWVRDAGGASTAPSSTPFSVADAPLSPTGMAVTPVTGAPFSGVVATFTDADPAGAIPDYTATITWGNGTTSTGTIAANGPGFTVTGTSTYTADGTYAIAVTIKDAVGSSAPANSTAYVGGLATHLSVTAAAAATAGTPFALTVTALDAAGNPAYSYAGTVHLTSTDAKAVLPADYPFTAGDLGTHAFSATLETAKAQSVTITDTANGKITGKQAGIVVRPGAVSQFQVVTKSSSVTAGKALNVTVTAQDAYGNTVTGYTGTVHFTSTDAQAVLPADYTFTAADAGKHTFSVTPKTAGSQTVTVTDTASSVVTGTSGAITVNPAAATHFRISAPASVSRGVPFSFTVTALDDFGNVATGYLGTVAFTSSDTKARLPANYTFTAANAGVAAFTATFNTVGVQSLTATDTKTKSITGMDGSIQVS